MERVYKSVKKAKQDIIADMYHINIYGVSDEMYKRLMKLPLQVIEWLRGFE